MEEQYDPVFQLLVSAQKGCIKHMEEVLNNGVDVNTQDLMFNETPMMMAVRYGQEAAVKFLLSRGADVNVRSINGQTALHIAVSNSKINVLIYILGLPGIEKDVQDKDGKTPLMLAAHKGLIHELRVLLQHGCRVDVTNARRQAAVHFTQMPYQGPVGNVAGFHCLQELTYVGADFDAEDKDHMTPLHYAIKQGNFHSVKWLISQNCDLDVVAGFEMLELSCEGDGFPAFATPLTLAVYFLNVRVVRLLLDSCAVKQGHSHLIPYAERCPEIHAVLLAALQSPETLLTMARRRVRKCLGRNIQVKVNSLTIPTRIKEYILHQ